MDDLTFLHDSYDVNDDRNAQGKTDQKPKIIIVEDDAVLGLSIQKYLSRVLNCNVFHYYTAEDCLQAILPLGKSEPFCLVTDISLGNGSDGLWLIDTLQEKDLNFVSIAMTGFGSIETAILATKKGVFHYLTKPFELENLRDLVIQAISKKLKINISSNERVIVPVKKRSELGKIELEKPSKEDLFCGMIGRSRVMKNVFERILKVAESDSTVLITGPSGTGKELVAGAIHNLSKRKDENKVNVNCGAIPGELLESELFGHIKGAFTGAISNREGRFDKADKGTIFLDEIGDMPALLQVKLLRVLQNKQIEPVGASSTIDVNVRVISATHRDLEKAVAEGKFREDLFYRLNVIPVHIPPLKERREDIPLLVSHFVDRFVSADRSNEISFSEEAIDLILGYDWPGNVRELENVIERLVILRGGNMIQSEDLPAKIFRHNPLSTNFYKNIFELPKDGVNLKKILSEIEDSLIIQALERTDGNKNQASKLLTLNRTTLIEKMKKKVLSL